MINIKPFHDFVLVERRELPPPISGQSLIITPDTFKEKPNYGHVLAAGPGRLLDNGQLAPMSVRAGDDIVFGKYAGIEIELEGKKIIVMKESEILGRLSTGE